MASGEEASMPLAGDPTGSEEAEMDTVAEEAAGGGEGTGAPAIPEGCMEGGADVAMPPPHPGAVHLEAPSAARAPAAPEGEPEEEAGVEEPVLSTNTDTSMGHCEETMWGVGRSAAAKSEVFAQEIRREDLHLRVGVQSVQGARKTMEDEHQIINEEHSTGKVAFFGVYDGHAGKKAAEFLRDQLHTSLYNNAHLESDPESALREAIMGAEAAFLARAKEEKLDDGSTLAVVLIIGNEIVTANVGDSEIVLCRGDKPLVLSTAHNMMKNTAEEQRVKDAGGVVFRSRLGHPYINPQLISIAVTRSIGDITFKDTDFTNGRPSGLIAMPDTRRVTLTTEDEFFLIGCDGLWDVMTHDEAVAFVKERLGRGVIPQKLSEHLVREALRRGSKDNVTVLVVTLKENPNCKDDDDITLFPDARPPPPIPIEVVPAASTPRPTES